MSSEASGCFCFCFPPCELCNTIQLQFATGNQFSIAFATCSLLESVGIESRFCRVVDRCDRRLFFRPGSFTLNSEARAASLPQGPCTISLGCHTLRHTLGPCTSKDDAAPIHVHKDAVAHARATRNMEVQQTRPAPFLTCPNCQISEPETIC